MADSLVSALPQLASNGIAAGATYALVAVGFSLVYGVARFFHFAHGAIFTSGSYLALGLVSSGMPLWAAVPSAVILATLLGMSSEWCVYRPMRRRYTSSLILLIASLGIYVIVQNTISLVCGDDVRTLRVGPIVPGLRVGSAFVTPNQIAIVLAATALTGLTALVLSRTRIGRATRAVANDPELASVTGIDSARVLLFVFGAASALAATAAILVCFDIDMVPTMGLNALLMGVVATIIGGVGSIPGAAIGGLLLGLAQNIGAWAIGSQWQDSIAFAILLGFLLFRPYGIFGRKLRKAEI